jgi:hypothetical protein
MSENPPSFPNAQQLADAALEHVRSVFRGNGIKKDSIKILSHTVQTHRMNAGTYLELKPVVSERNSPGRTTAGQLTTSRQEAMRLIDQAMLAAIANPVAKAQIANVLLERPDKGFGLNREMLPLDFLKKDFSWHEACPACRGSAQSSCQVCGGRRTETCMKCHGRGLMACPMCRATGLIHGNKCTRCHGQRYIPCDLCRRSGMMPCRACNGLGTSKCQACAGQGSKTYILSLAPQAITYFQYDAKSVPKAAADVIETQAADLAARQQIKIRGRVADDKENVLGASYEVEFPSGEIIFAIGKKEAKASLFGYKAGIENFPLLLDKMIAPAVRSLEEAANGIGSVAGKIRSATRYRVIAQAFLAANKLPDKKAVAALLKNFDLGLSRGMAEKLVMLADKTSANITRKPRYYGLVGGLVLTAGLCAAYYLLPVRSAIATYLPTPKMDFVLDILPAMTGGLLSSVAIKLSGSSAIRKALGHLFPAGKKNTMVSKVHGLGLWGYAAAAVLMVIFIEVAGHIGSGSPYWYEFVRNGLLSLIGG